MVLLVDVVSDKGLEDLGVRIKEALLKALQFLGEDDCSVEVSLLGDREMAGIAGGGHVPTVLSFEEPEQMPEIEGEPRRLGEIYLAPGAIREKGMDPVHVSVHGLLHLLGYTHGKRSDTIEMESLEDEIIENIS